MQRMLTLEDAAEQCRSVVQHNRRVNDIQDGNETANSNDNDEGERRDTGDGQFDPADYTDHLYDSDGGSAQQSQNHFRQYQSDFKP